MAQTFIYLKDDIYDMYVEKIIAYIDENGIQFIQDKLKNKTSF